MYSSSPSKRSPKVWPVDPLQCVQQCTEYEALIHGVRIAISLGIKQLIAYDDYKVVIDQVNNVCDIKKDMIYAHFAEVQKLEAHF